MPAHTENLETSDMATDFKPTVDSIIAKLGGTSEAAKLLGVSQSLIRKTRRLGFSWWHWHIIMEKGGYRAGDIYRANVTAAGKHYKIPQPKAAA